MAWGNNENSKPSLAREPTTPVRYRCKVGGEWKPLDAFSNSQQQLIQRQADSGRPINAANSGMTCREHSAACRTEIRCEVCVLIKPVEDFSKNSRKDGENICKRCTAWDETQEPEVTPAPLESGHISIEETNREVWQENYVESSDFFEDGAMPQAPVTDLASLGLEDHEVSSQARSVIGGSDIMSAVADPQRLARLLPGIASGSGSGRASEAGRQSDAGSRTSVPSHLRGSISSTSGSNESSARRSRTPSAASSEVASVSVPPHLRSRVLARAASNSSYSVAGSEDSGKGLGVGSVSTATTLREARGDKGASKIPFNAWAPDGQQCKGIKSPTVRSGTDGESAPNPSSDSGESGANEWQTVGSKEKRKKGNWAKAPRLPASELRKETPYPHVSARHIDPDVDRQRRMNYCESEDSDF